jgi:uncharacterized protein (DUF2237 family)
MNEPLPSAQQRLRGLNVLGLPLQACGTAPVTGFLRDGYCCVPGSDAGVHGVCAVMDEAFLHYTLQRGNDLITPRPQWQFPGLRPGDRWCVCASRWLEALHAGVAPKVVLASTSEKVLDIIRLEDLLRHAVDAPASKA